MHFSNTARSPAEKSAPPPEPLDLVWGAESIGVLLGKSKRATFNMLERGYIPGAKKIGGQWVVSRRKLASFFEGQD